MTSFLVQIPISDAAETIQISKSGKVLKSFNPKTQLLIDTIQSIALSSFIRDASLEKKIFLGEAKAIQDIQSICQKLSDSKKVDNFSKVICGDTVVESILGLRRELNEALNNSTTTSGPLDLVKSQVLSNIDLIVLQSIGSPVIQARQNSFSFRVLPLDSFGILSVASVTQGTYGVVSINKDGGLTYKPNTKTPKTDSLTVTFQDIEGATIIKTITIVTPCAALNVKNWENRFFN